MHLPHLCAMQSFKVADLEAGQAGKMRAAAEWQKAIRAKKGKEKGQEDEPELGLLRDDGELDCFDEEEDHGDDDDPTIATASLDMHTESDRGLWHSRIR